MACESGYVHGRDAHQPSGGTDQRVTVADSGAAAGRINAIMRP